jgi:hypothetical protein
MWYLRLYRKDFVKNVISEILCPDKRKISPGLQISLLKIIPTSVSVERSFSKLKKMLTADRNFKPSNIYNYFCFYVNSNSVPEENGN